MWLGVIQGHRQHNNFIERIDFLFECNRNYEAILYRFQDIIAYFPNVKEVM